MVQNLLQPRAQKTDQVHLGFFVGTLNSQWSHTSLLEGTLPREGPHLSIPGCHKQTTSVDKPVDHRNMRKTSLAVSDQNYPSDYYNREWYNCFKSYTSKRFCYAVTAYVSIKKKKWYFNSNPLCWQSLRSKMCFSIQGDLLTECMFFYLWAVIDPYKSMQHLFEVEKAAMKIFFKHVYICI